MAQTRGSISPANRPQTPVICYSNPKQKPLNPRTAPFVHSSPQSVPATEAKAGPSQPSAQSQSHAGSERYRSQTASNTMGKGLSSAGQSGPPPNAPTGPRFPNTKARTFAVISQSQSGPPLNAPRGPRHQNVQAMATQALGCSRPSPASFTSVNVANVSAGLPTRALKGPVPAAQRQTQYVIRVREAMRPKYCCLQDHAVNEEKFGQETSWLIRRNEAHLLDCSTRCGRRTSHAALEWYLPWRWN